jgi:hypothetical protein
MRAFQIYRSIKEFFADGTTEGIVELQIFLMSKLDGGDFPFSKKTEKLERFVFNDCVLVVGHLDVKLITWL